MLTIAHLDDHKLFQKGVSQLITGYFPDVNYITFHHPTDALHFIEESLHIDAPIHLIITDLNHSGDNGCDFARKIRQTEKHYSKRHPIMLLTIVEEKHSSIVAAQKDRVFDCYLHKAVDIDMLIQSVRHLIRLK